MPVNEILDVSEVFMYTHTHATASPGILTTLPIPRSGHLLRAIAVVSANYDGICAITFQLGNLNVGNGSNDHIVIPATAVVGDIHSIDFSENNLTGCKVAQDGDVDADRSSLEISSDGGGSTGAIHMTIVVGK